MPSTKVVKGRLIDSSTVALDEPVRGVATEVQVVVQQESDPSNVQYDNIDDFLNSIPEGTRTRADIDRQVAEERASWGDDL
jgi:hypothetical protein